MEICDFDIEDYDIFPELPAEEIINPGDFTTMLDYIFPMISIKI